MCSYVKMERIWKFINRFSPELRVKMKDRFPGTERVRVGSFSVYINDRKSSVDLDRLSNMCEFDRADYIDVVCDEEMSVDENLCMYVCGYIYI